MTSNATRPKVEARAKAGKGPRPKHVPERMCVVCRDKGGKRTLTRVVRLSDGTIEIDPTGKKNGRGAYLCDNSACWQRAATTDVLGQGLRATLSSDTRAYLSAYAAEHHPAESSATNETNEKETLNG